jgi:hypothetical protein
VAEKGRSFEAAKSGFAAVGLLFAASVVSGGVTPIEPHGGWATFVSGALWLGLPLVVAVNRYRKVPAIKTVARSWARDDPRWLIEGDWHTRHPREPGAKGIDTIETPS